MEGTDNNIQRPFRGLITDTSPFDQPKETYRYALNALNETIEGNTNFLSMENAIEKCETLPEGAVPVGKCYMNDDSVCVWLKDNDGYDYIGIINKYHEYVPHVKTKVLELSVDNPVKGVFRLRRNNSRVVYWVDGDNKKPRTFNFDRVSDFYSIEYDEYLYNLADDVPDNFTGEKWEKIHFDLIKGYEFVPEFRDVKVQAGGSVASGSYSISVQLVDANMNPTEWITTSNPVNIYNESLKSDYRTIRGSRNIQTNHQRFPESNKKITWTLGNLDPNFNYYRVAVMVANQEDGNVNQALVSELKAIDNTTFTFTGSVSGFTETPVSDILVSRPDIAGAEYIEQLENRLILANTKGTDIDWCSFQRYASMIKSELVTKTIKLEDVEAKGNPKNPVTPFDTVGYMWDEVYSYGIVYEIDGGIESPVFHIPGKPEGVDNGLDFYETTDGSNYIDIDSCLPYKYWGVDAWGNELTDQPIRHHKFPQRTTAHKRSDKETEICGIKFTNVIKPHSKVTGYKIVRNKRGTDDKLVVDNAIIGPLVTDNTDDTNNYHAFGLLFPEITSDKRSTKGAYIFSPEHQFNNDPLNFDEIEVLGTYDQDYKYVPTYRDEVKGTGAYAQDVSPGTTYNEEFHRTKDPDGFDLQVMYRSNDPAYSASQYGEPHLPEIKNKYSVAASNHRTEGDTIFFNASTDNKIVIASFVSDIQSNVFEEGGTKRLLYACLKKNVTNAYSDFMMRPYYKEHNNTYYFESDAAHQTDEIYNGDCYTNPMTVVSTVYVDTVFAERDKKSKVWKIVLGGLLTIAGIALMLIPGAQGAGAAALAVSAEVFAAITVMAISYGVSTLSSGIQFEIMKQMIDESYEAGLKYCIEDDDNWIEKDDYGVVTGGTFLDPTQNDDDKFCWFSDRVDNLYFDSAVNIGLRSGMTIGLSDFVNSPSPRLSGYPLDGGGNENPNLGSSSSEGFETYLINKLTTLDRERGAGRLYMGIPTSEFYDLNLDYLRKNNEKVYDYLPLEYDCCSKSREDFRNRVHYSEQSYQEEILDNYRVFLPNNYKDIESSTGEITNIFRYNNSLYIHTSEALYHLPQNLQQQVTQELVTFIGTGAFFSIPPRKISDGATSVAGSRHYQATVVTEFGVFFVSESESKVFLYSEGLKDLTIGNTSYFKNNLKSYLYEAIKDNVGEQYIHKYDNSFSENMIGIHSVYDERFARIILTKIDYKPLKPFSLHDGSNSPSSFVYNPDAKKFGVIGANSEFIEVEFTNSEYFENKSFTMSYSLKNQMWVSWHSYLPRMYIGTPKYLYSFVERDSAVYLHNNEEKFCKFYGKTYPFIVELNSVSNPIQTRIWNHIALHTVVNRYHTDFKQLLHDYEHFFEIMTLYNERQLSGAIHLKVKSAKEDPEDWLLQQVQNKNHEAIVNRVEDIWYVNDFRDFVVDKEQPLFSKHWIDVKHEFPIDKVINQDAIDLDKDWSELEVFRGKYLTIRLAYYGENTDNDIQITINYVVDNEQPSLR